MFLGQIHDFRPVAEIHCTGRTYLDAGRRQAVFHPVTAHITLGQGTVLSLTRNVIGAGFADFRGVQPARVGRVNHGTGCRFSEDSRRLAGGCLTGSLQAMA